MKRKLFFLFLPSSLLVLCFCNDRKEDRLLQEAAQVHHEVFKMVEELEEMLAGMQSAEDVPPDSVETWQKILITCEDNLIEVPGHEADKHGSHQHHHHAPDLDLTSEQFLNIQLEVKAKVEDLKKRISSYGHD